MTNDSTAHDSNTHGDVTHDVPTDDVPTDDVPTLSHDQAQRLSDRLHRTFRSGVTRPIRWRQAQLDALARLLRDNAAELTRAVHADLGKPAAETKLMEIGLVLDEIRFVRARVRRWSARHPKPMPLLMQPAVGWTLAEPKGVALIISPWNYPLMLTFEPLADAIAAGCCACLKPSELSPRTSALIASLVPRYLDPDAVAVVQGGATETGMLLDLPFDHLFYTGGGRVGRIVMAAAAKRLTPVTLELGGKSPVFVDGTANLEVAARRIAWGRFINAGQTCVAPDYVLATPDVIGPLTERIVVAVRRMFGDDPKQSASFGRIVSERHVRRLAALLPAGDDGPHVACGGEVDVAARYVAPTVLTGVSPDDPVMQEEIFGPILPVLEVADAREAVAFVTARDRPLAAYVFSRDRRTRTLFERETSSGALGFGLTLGHLTSSRLPFGGVGGSGMGAYHGKAGFLEFSHVKTVVGKPSLPDTLSLAYPPYDRLKRTLADIVTLHGRAR
ncbi:aldehyde dehydrogenase family protein [Bifidobacterium leontopitheci]|uniref:Aldehyde dehydrogenase n=1 Tax=Bifidobacterium leontopitheci TaxID=2650774 RepID=A0A6I1GHI8_9BIFI|nr:aldehyde dehydrogenase family protein [Bifidobacterium leontopitheci]KAB7791124.1 aldehyde dehydrogenase [Bifidobacterium leontopitheci]